MRTHRIGFVKRKQRVNCHQPARDDDQSTYLVHLAPVSNHRLVYSVVTSTGVTAGNSAKSSQIEAELFTAAFDHGQALIAQTLIAAVQDQKRWLTRVRTALISILRFLDQEPGGQSFC